MKPKSNLFLRATLAKSSVFPTILAVLVFSNPAAFADATWVGDTSQDWNNAANWSSDPANPTGNFFINNATLGVHPVLAADSAFAPVDVIIGSGGGTGRLHQNAGSLSAGNGNWLIVGDRATGTYNLSGGTMTAAEVHMARIPNEVANATASATVTVGGGIGTATLSTGGRFYVSNGGNNTAASTGTLNVESGGTVNSEGDLFLAFAGGSSTLGVVNIAAGGTVNVGSAFERWVIMNVWDSARGELNVNGGTLNLHAGTDIRFSTGSWGPGASVGPSSINLNGGAINGGSGSVLDLNQNGESPVANSLNLNGGTLSISQILSGKEFGARVVNFDGGTLKATASSTSFFAATATSATNILAGGAIIDSNGFDITIGETLLGAGDLTKSGAGKLILSGASSYTGQTTVTAGTLDLAGSLTSDIVVNGSTITGSGSTSGTLTLNAGSSLVVGTSTNGLTVSNGVTFAGPTELLFNGSLVETGVYTVINYGAGPGPNLANLIQTSRGSLADAGGSITFTAGTVGSRTWNTNTGVWAVGGLTTNWAEDDKKFYNGDTVIFNERPAASTVTLTGTLLPAEVIVSNTTNPYTFSGTGFITGDTILSKDGAGALTLSTANTYSGGTNLNDGKLNINSASAIGTGTLAINGGLLDNTSGATVSLTTNNAQTWNANFTFTGSNNLDMGSGPVNAAADITVTIAANTLTVGEITASGGLNKLGAGKLEVTSSGVGAGASTVAGVLNIAAGTLQFNRSGANATDSGDFTVNGLSGSGTLVNGAEVQRWFFTTPGTGVTATFSGTLANGDDGALGFFKGGEGTQILSGPNTNSGRTTVAAGILSITNPVLADSGEVFIEAAGVLNLNHSATDQIQTLDIAGVVQPAGVYGSANTARITGSGKLRVGPPGYADWAYDKGVTGLADADFDGDGVENGIEYFMGADGTSFTPNPGIENGKIIWDKNPDFLGTYTVQTSADLVDWEDVPSAVVGNTVEYIVPPGEEKLFVRLKVGTN